MRQAQCRRPAQSRTDRIACTEAGCVPAHRSLHAAFSRPSAQLTCETFAFRLHLR